ncbi:MAG TPA: radical SAM protein [Gammaproteobacteria bacterium]|nr:radical SAM protein [Gammaproteobacteria bacterium]
MFIEPPSTKTENHTATENTEKLKPIKGRGAIGNPKHRFTTKHHEKFHDEWEIFEFNEPAPKTILIRESAKTIVSSNNSPDIGFDQSINPYRGCEHGCIYCYARPTHAYWDMSPGLDFETHIVIKENAAEQLRKTLSKPGYRVSPICIGANTDPYQPAESLLKITRSVIEVFKEFKHPFSIITKSHLIERDLDLIAPLAEQKLCNVAVTVTTLNRDLKRLLEPRAPDGLKRLNTIRTLSEHGVNVTMMAAPIIPYINDNELESLLEEGKSSGAIDARYILIRLPHEISPMFQDWLKVHFPSRSKKVMTVIQESRGGKNYQSAFGERMRGVGKFAELLHQRWQISHRKLGFPESIKKRHKFDTTLFRSNPGQLNLF